MSATRTAIFTSLLCLAVVNCATPGPPLSADVTDPARRTYYEGMRELVDGDYTKASTLFQAVAASPRHVKYAALAKLRLGDALFAQSRYAEATEVYRSFIQQHATNPNIPYARFKVAQCYYERLPTDWFASPPAHEFDQTITAQAKAELTGFVTMFPTSVYAPEAREMLATTRKMLFDSEMFVADFYEDNDKWQAVAWRIDESIESYPELAVRDDLVWRLAVAWDKVGDNKESARALALYLEKFPEGARAARAKQRLATIEEELRAESEAEDAPTPEEAPLPDVPETPLRDPASSPEEDGESGELQLRPPELPELSPEPEE